MGAPAVESDTQEEGPDTALEHLDGARCLCAIWILCCNFIPVEHAGGWLAAQRRGNAAVDFFVVLSGFVTHWVYEPHRVRVGDLRSFYLRRIGRVLLLTWLTMLLALPLDGSSGAAHYAKCFLFWENAVPGSFTPCPNPPTWTVASLLPCWLLAPVMSRAVVAVSGRFGFSGLAALAALLWGVWCVPLLIHYVGSGLWLPASYYAPTYLWPGAMLPDFMLGSVVAAMVRRDTAMGDALDGSGRGASDGERADGLNPVAQGHIADACAALAAAAVVFVPGQSGQLPETPGRLAWAPWSADALAGVDVLYGHVLSLPLAAFLYASVASEGAGSVASLLRFRGLAGLGRYGLEVYLLQWPLFEYVRLGVPTLHKSAEGFMACFVALWFIAGLVHNWVMKPLSGRLLESAKAGGDSDSARSMLSDDSDG